MIDGDWICYLGQDFIRGQLLGLFRGPGGKPVTRYRPKGEWQSFESVAPHQPIDVLSIWKDRIQESIKLANIYGSINKAGVATAELALAIIDYHLEKRRAA